jgi:hypothetical protein
MKFTSKRTAVVLAALLPLATVALAQQTTTYTNRWGDSVTDTRSLQNGQYTNDKSVTNPNGKTFTNDKTASLNNNGRLATQDILTRPNGKSASKDTTYGRYGSRSTVTGPNGGSHTFYRRR